MYNVLRQYTQYTPVTRRRKEYTCVVTCISYYDDLHFTIVVEMSDNLLQCSRTL